MHGIGASILWGSNAVPAARLAKWAISKGKTPGEWILAAALGPGGVDAFKIRQTRLYFTAPRLGGGFWMWPIKTVAVGTAEIRAQLGPPEQ